MEFLRRATGGGAVARKKAAAVEEGRPLVSHGGTPRAKQRRRADAQQRRSTINMPTQLLLAPLANLVQATDGVEAQMDELSTLLRHELHYDLQQSALWLVDSFDLLAGEGGANSSARLGAIAAANELEGNRVHPLSDRFIDGLCSLMQRGNYRLLSQREASMGMPSS
jgi:hypothetical protein